MDTTFLARRLLRSLWHGARQAAWGVDAYSRLAHGMDVPADHRARRHPTRGGRRTG